MSFLRISDAPMKLRWQRVKTRIGFTCHEIIFWAKLQFQIQTYLQRVHNNETSLRRRTVHELLGMLGLDGHKHLNPDVHWSLDLAIPERRYWVHWSKLWKFTEEPSELNVVLGILAFTLYITQVCDTCAKALETQGYRIHVEFGVQRRVITDGGNVQWDPCRPR